MNKPVGSLFVVLALVFASGCSSGPTVSESGADSKAKTVEQISDEKVEQYFEAIAANDIDEMESGLASAARGSIAEAYMIHMIAVANSSLDAGVPEAEPETLTAKKEGYESCGDDGTGKQSCVVWGNIEGKDGKITNFTVSGKRLDDRISVGNDKFAKAGRLAEVRFISAYKSVETGGLTVDIEIKSNERKVETNLFGSTYRSKEGRQSKATETIGLDALEPKSTTFASVYFDRADLGGDLKLAFFDPDYNEVPVIIKTAQ